MEKITAYLCSKTAEAIGYEPFNGDIGSVAISAGKVIAQLWPEVSTPGCRGSAGKIKTKLLKTGGTKYCQEEGSLTWTREDIPYAGEPVGLESYITIKVGNSGHCHWVQSVIKAYGADGSIFGRLFGLVDVGSGGQDCPDNKSDVFSGGGQSSFLMTQNQIVPGETIELMWVFWDGQHTEEISVAAEAFCTCCFTGGKIISVNGEYGDVDITYTVDIQGKHTTCVSSDFVEYGVGDWVFVLNPNSTCAETDRLTACKNGCQDVSNGMILPLRIGSYGP